MEGDRHYRIVFTPAKRETTRGTSATSDRIRHWQHQSAGATHRSLEERTAVGRIWKEDGDDMEDDPESLAPLMLAVRPASHGGFNRSLKGWHVAGQNAVLENRHCLKLRLVEGNFVETLWVDPNRDDLIVGWARSLGSSRALSFATIDYRHDSSAGWIPVRWTEIDESQPGQPRDESFVVGRSINQPIEPKSLALNFLRAQRSSIKRAASGTWLPKTARRQTPSRSIRPNRSTCLSDSKSRLNSRLPESRSKMDSA